MPDKGAIEQSLFSNQLKDTLNNLNATLIQLTGTREMLGVGAKLDSIMSQLAYRYPNAPARVTKEYNAAAFQMQQAVAGETQSAMTELMRQQDMLAANRQALQAELSMNNPMNNIKGPSESTVIQDATAAAYMNRMSRPFLDSSYISAEKAGYYGAAVSDPYYASEIFTSNSYQGSLSPTQRAITEQQYLNSLAASGSPEQMRRYNIHSQFVAEETQKAMLNQHLSASMGIKGGMMRRGEFESMVLPAVSGFAEDINAPLDEAASVLRRLKDLRLIANDVRSGSGSDAVMAVHEASKLIASISGLIKSNDITELVTAARQLRNIGGGDVRAGIHSVLGKQHSGLLSGRDESLFGSTEVILGDMRDPSYDMSEAMRNAGIFGQFFGGNTASAMNMGAWSHRFSNLMARHGTGDYMGYTGNEEQAASILSGIIAQRASGVQGMLYNAGGGFDIMAGADKLSGKAGTDPVQFYLNMNKDMAAASRAQSGAGARLNITRDIRNLMAQGLTETEAQLTVLGSPQGIEAYKEILAAETGAAEGVERRVQAGRLLNVVTPSKNLQLFYDRNNFLSDPSDILSRTGESETGAFLQGFFVDPFRDIGAGITERLSYGIRSGQDASYNFRGLQRTRRDTSIDTSFRRDMSRSNLSILSHLPAVADTDAAREKTESILERIGNMNRPPSIADIREIFTAGLQDYMASGAIDASGIRSLAAYIAGITPAKAAKDLLPIFNADTTIHKLIRVLFDPKLTSSLFTSSSQVLRAVTAGSLYESGLSESVIKNMISADEGWARETAGLLEDYDLLAMGTSSAVLGLAGLATGGLPALAGLAVGIAAVPVITASLEVGADIHDYYQVHTGQKVDIEALDSFLGSGSAYQRELRAYAGLIRSGLTASWKAVLGQTADKTVKSMMQTLFNSYSRAYFMSNTDKKTKDPMPAARLNAVIAELGSAGGITAKIEGGQAKIAAILRALNRADSQAGKMLRENRRNVSAVLSDLNKVMDDVSGDLGTFGGWKGAVKSFENLAGALEGSGLDMSQTLIEMAQAGGAQEAAKDYAEIERMIMTEAQPGSEQDTLKEVISKVRDAITSKDYSKVVFSNTELEAMTKVFGKEFTDQFRGITDLPDEERRRIITGAWSSLSGKAGTVMQSADTSAAEFVRVLYRMADLITGNPGDSGAVSKNNLKSILKGNF